MATGKFKSKRNPSRALYSPDSKAVIGEEGRFSEIEFEIG